MDDGTDDMASVGGGDATLEGGAGADAGADAGAAGAGAAGADAMDAVAASIASAIASVPPVGSSGSSSVAAPRKPMLRWSTARVIMMLEVVRDDIAAALASGGKKKTWEQIAAVLADRLPGATTLNVMSKFAWVRARAGGWGLSLSVCPLCLPPLSAPPSPNNP